MSNVNYHWLAYMQFLDSALPVGGFAHSFGLETMVQSEKLVTINDLKSYIQTMLVHSWAPGEAMGVKAVYQYAPLANWDSLWQLDRILHVQRTAAETREGMLKMGKRLLRLAQPMYPHFQWEPLLSAIRAGHCFGTHPIIHGWISWQLQIPLDAAAEGYLYTCTMNAINSALRLMSIGQTAGQTLLAELLPQLTEAWVRVSAMEPLACYSSVPAADIYMMQHESLYSRLFMS